MIEFDIKSINLIKMNGRYTAAISIGNKDLDILCKLRIWLQFKLSEYEVRMIEECYELPRDSLCMKTFCPHEAHKIPESLVYNIKKFVSPILRDKKKKVKNKKELK